MERKITSALFVGIMVLLISILIGLVLAPSVDNGQAVNIIIKGLNCEDEVVNLDFYEVDNNGNDLISPGSYGLPTTATFSNNIINVSWNSVWFDDADGDDGDNDPEIFFTATCVSSGSSLDSDILEIGELTPDCVIGAEITNACLCEGIEYSNGYCCSDGWSASQCVVTNTYHIIEGGRGDRDGRDWDHADDDIPTSSLQRGYTYYVADGSYPGRTFSNNPSGTQYITIKKATELDHGSPIGWQPGDGNGQAVFDGSVRFSAPYYILDGNEQYGIRIVSSWAIEGLDVNGDYVTIRNCEIDGNFAVDGGGQQISGGCNAVDLSANHLIFEYNDVHSFPDDGVGVDDSYIYVGYNKIHDLYSCGCDPTDRNLRSLCSTQWRTLEGGQCGPCYNGHSDLLEIDTASHVLLEGNFLYNGDIATNGLTSAMFHIWGGADNINMTYRNNIFYAPRSGFPIYLSDINGLDFYNNVVWGGNYAGIAMGNDISDMDMYNNIIYSINYNHMSSSYIAGEHRGDNNIFGVAYGQQGFVEADHGFVDPDPRFSGIGAWGDPEVSSPIPEYFTLETGSSAINEGYVGDVNIRIPALDYFGNARIGNPDIGIHEYGGVLACSGTDTHCGVHPDCNNCNIQDGCAGGEYRDYYCSNDNCNSYHVITDTESDADGNCNDGEDNDCDGNPDMADPDCTIVCEVSSGAWANHDITPQTSTFTIAFEATPSTAGSVGSDGLVGVSNGPGSTFSDYSILVRFNTSNQIDAYNQGTGYQSLNTVAYTPDTTYQFRIEVDVSNERYDVYVNDGSGEVQIANNYAFRASANELNSWGLLDEGSFNFEVCNFNLGGCTTAGDCLDRPCNDKACNGGVCEYTSNDGLSCDDNLFCTGTETCSGGDCSSSGDPCGIGETCNEDTNNCDPDPCSGITSCSDYDGTSLSECESNACIAGCVWNNPLCESPPVQTRQVIDDGNGIIWHFDKEYPAGQFVNGDWWVEGPVKITRVEPDLIDSGGDYHNGWQINPTYNQQSFDSRPPAFNAALLPNFNQDIYGNVSIVKAISGTRNPGEYYWGGPSPGCQTEGQRNCLTMASVLTVLDHIPENNGNNMFRPSYAGTEKKFYSTNDIVRSLPNLDATGIRDTTTRCGSSLAECATYFRYPRISHLNDYNQYIHPIDYMDHEGSVIAIQNAEALMMLMLDKPGNKNPLLYGFLQSGIDYHGAYKEGSVWYAKGSHGHGRLLPISFVAVMFDDQEIKDDIANADIYDFAETSQARWANKGVALYGDINWFGDDDPEHYYWEGSVFKDQGSRATSDVYGYIDGRAYLYCCSFQPWKYEVMAARLMPEHFELWKDYPIVEFTDRYTHIGLWRAPDPCAPATDGNCDGSSCTSADDDHCSDDCDTYEGPGYRVTYGPDPNNPGMCIPDQDGSDGWGRFPQTNGTDVNTGGFPSGFGEDVYIKHRGLYDPLRWCGDNTCDNGYETSASCEWDCGASGSFNPFSALWNWIKSLFS